MDAFSAGALLQLVLPRLLTMTLVSFVVGSAVGAVVGALATLIGRRAQRGQPSPSPRRWLIKPAIAGSFLGMLLIGTLPIQANPASRVGGPYGALWAMVLFALLAPTGALAGAGLGAWIGVRPPKRFRPTQLLGAAVLITYLICFLVLAVGLSSPGLVLRTVPARAGDLFPVVAELTGYEGIPNDLALSPNGQQLAIIDVQYSEASVDLWDLPGRRRLQSFLAASGGSRTLKDSLASVGFSADGRDLFTAAIEQVQVRQLPSGAVHQRLEGSYVALPAAGDRLVTLAAVDTRSPQPEPYDLKVWELGSGRLLQTIPANFAPYQQPHLPLALSPDRHLLAVAPAVDGNPLEVWDLPRRRLLSTVEHPDAGVVRALGFSPDGRSLAVAGSQGPPLAIWNWRSGQPLRTLPQAARAETLHWSRGGLLVAADGDLTAWDPQGGRKLKTLEVQPPGLSPQPGIRLPLGPIALSADRTTLSAFIPRVGVRVWRVG
ncbi:WD40 repeat domain-containing protein [Cyanobium sp. Morenito 9A2]|uniref:WD40 repeat domain-containing protein n=1 Tax=Cyanobium sp. Morenito 9A2 TaxID=2823718 RepID=UPI0020CDFA21|nr:WD40 repeat domain-containing protein [Cyanobium sp. Morenito 9A2]MCP9850391.1 WD40 repeat domain-containing protein [Cyanobium sp. Morenito 9A2]